jgi:hypothetical protein
MFLDGPKPGALAAIAGGLGGGGGGAAATCGEGGGTQAASAKSDIESRAKRFILLFLR